MRKFNQDDISKIECLIGEIQALSKDNLNRDYYERLIEEANEWLEEIRKVKIEEI